MTLFICILVTGTSLWILRFVHRRVKRPGYKTGWWVSFWILFGVGLLLGLSLCGVSRQSSETTRVSGWPFVVGGAESYGDQWVSGVARYPFIPVTANVFFGLGCAAMPLRIVVWIRERREQLTV